MRLSMKVTLVVLIAVGYLGSPTMLIWGWLRWVKQPRSRTAPSILSFTGFILSTASALLAVASIAYAQAIHGFPYYDPLLLKIFRWGILLSLGGDRVWDWRPLASECTALAYPRFRGVPACVLDNDGVR